MGTANAILFPILVGLFIITSEHTYYVVRIKSESVENRKQFRGQEEDVLSLFSISCITLFLDFMLTLFLDAFPRLVTKHLLPFSISVCITTLVLIVYFIRVKKSEEVNLYKTLYKYRMNMLDIERQLKNIENMKTDIYNNSTIEETDKEEQFKLLNDSSNTLRKAYSDVKQAYNSMVLMGTFKETNELKLTDESKKELQKQIDIFDAAQRL